MAKRTNCPITRARFREKAPVVKVTIDGRGFTLEKKEFSTGSLGWHLNGKLALDVGGKRVQAQIGLSLTVIGSMFLPDDQAGAGGTEPGVGRPPPEAARRAGRPAGGLSPMYAELERLLQPPAARPTGVIAEMFAEFERRVMEPPPPWPPPRPGGPLSREEIEQLLRRMAHEETLHALIVLFAPVYKARLGKNPDEAAKVDLAVKKGEILLSARRERVLMLLSRGWPDYEKARPEPHGPSDR